MFNLDQKTNLQIPESTPHISDELAIPSAIGQGTHSYTTSQLARYALTIRNNRVSYDLNLLDKVDRFLWESPGRILAADFQADAAFSGGLG